MLINRNVRTAERTDIRLDEPAACGRTVTVRDERIVESVTSNYFIKRINLLDVWRHRGAVWQPSRLKEEFEQLFTRTASLVLL